MCLGQCLNVYGMKGFPYLQLHGQAVYWSLQAHDYYFACCYQVIKLWSQLPVASQAVVKVWDWLLPPFATPANIRDQQLWAGRWSNQKWYDWGCAKHPFCWEPESFIFQGICLPSHVESADETLYFCGFMDVWGNYLEEIMLKLWLPNVSNYWNSNCSIGYSIINVLHDMKLW